MGNVVRGAANRMSRDVPPEINLKEIELVFVPKFVQQCLT